jgi:hypothetical protein
MGCTVLFDPCQSLARETLQANVYLAQADEFGETQAGLQGQQNESVVPAPEWRRQIGSAEQCLRFWPRQKVDQPSRV